jgi:hypothetical protein
MKVGGDRKTLLKYTCVSFPANYYGIRLEGAISGRLSNAASRSPQRRQSTGASSASAGTSDFGPVGPTCETHIGDMFDSFLSQVRDFLSSLPKDGSPNIVRGCGGVGRCCLAEGRPYAMRLTMPPSILDFRIGQLAQGHACLRGSYRASVRRGSRHALCGKFSASSGESSACSARHARKPAAELRTLIDAMIFSARGRSVHRSASSLISAP